MKGFILSILLLLLSACYVQAQCIGIRVDFSSLNGAVYNPGTHDDKYDTLWVTDRTNEEWSLNEKAFLDDDFEVNHPGFIILDEATVTYNCHGYTFGLIQGTDRYNIQWWHRALFATNQCIFGLPRIDIAGIFAKWETV